MRFEPLSRADRIRRRAFRSRDVRRARLLLALADEVEIVDLDGD